MGKILGCPNNTLSFGSESMVLRICRYLGNPKHIFLHIKPFHFFFYWILGPKTLLHFQYWSWLCYQDYDSFRFFILVFHLDFFLGGFIFTISTPGLLVWIICRKCCFSWIFISCSFRKGYFSFTFRHFIIFVYSINLGWLILVRNFFRLFFV